MIVINKSIVYRTFKRLYNLIIYPVTLYRMLRFRYRVWRCGGASNIPPDLINDYMYGELTEGENIARQGFPLVMGAIGEILDKPFTELKVYNLYVLYIHMETISNDEYDDMVSLHRCKNHSEFQILLFNLAVKYEGLFRRTVHYNVSKRLDIRDTYERFLTGDVASAYDLFLLNASKTNASLKNYK